MGRDDPRLLPARCSPPTRWRPGSTRAFASSTRPRPGGCASRRSTRRSTELVGARRGRGASAAAAYSALPPARTDARGPRAAAQPGHGRPRAPAGRGAPVRSRRGRDEPEPLTPAEAGRRDRGVRRPCGRCSAAYRALRAPQGRALGPRLRGPPAPRAARCCATRAAVARPCARAVRAHDGRRVPGHEPGPARPDRAAAGARDPAVRRRRRAPVDLRLPQRRPRGLPLRAAPRRRPTPARAGAAAARQLPLAARGRSPPSTRSAACCSTASPSSPRAAPTPPAASPPGRRAPADRSDERSGDAPRLEGRRRSSSTRRPSETKPGQRRRGAVPRPPAARARRRREAERGGMVVLLRAFTHVDAYEEALERAGLDPYVVGGRGYWSHQQVEDIAAPARAASPTRSTTSCSSARWPRPPAASAPTRSGCFAAPPGSQRHVWPVVEWRYGGRRARARRASSRSGSTDVPERRRGAARAVLREPRRRCAPRRSSRPRGAGRARDGAPSATTSPCCPRPAGAGGSPTCAS